MADTYNLPEGFTLAPPSPNLVQGGGMALPEGFTLTPPPPPETFGQDVRDAFGMAGTMATNAAGQLLGLPHTVASLADKGIDWVGSKFSSGYQGGRPGFMTRITGSPQDFANDITGAASYLSQATGGKPVQPYQPKTDAERELMGLGSTALAAAVGNPATAGARIASGMGGDVGAQAAEQLVPGSAWAPIVGAVLGGGAGGLAHAGLNRSLAAVPYVGGESEITAANRRLGITDSLIGDATGSPTLQLLQNTALRLPGGGRVHTAMERGIDQWRTALEDTANGLAPARDAVQAGTALQTATQGWLDNFRTRSRNAYNAVDMEVPGATPVPLPNYGRTLTDVSNNMQSMPATAGTVTPSLSRDLLDNLISDAKGGVPDWRAVSTLRTRIGEMLANPPLVGDTSRTELERIYRSLTADMGATVAGRGPAAQQAWDAATTLTREGHDFINNTASRLLAPRGGIKPEDALNAAFGDDGTTLASIRQQMPQAADELAGYKLRDASLATPGRQNATGTAVSPTTFGTDMSRVQPTAHDALFASDPALAARVADLRTSANSMARTERLLNTSGTGAHMGTLAAWEGAMDMPLAAAELITKPSWEAAGKVARAAMPILAGPTMARLASSPFLVNAMSRMPPLTALTPAGRRAAGVSYPAIGGLLNQ